MIKVESIRIQEFRGIRDLTVGLASKNYAVCGPNGTGKSGIVDALEFGLTGNISRLSGKGRGDLSVKEHGPHVSIRTKPEKAIVTLVVSIPSLSKTATIVRNIKTSRAPVITPNTPDIRAAFDYVEQHPEFALSRREIIKYVLTEPGERAKELQALLQLDKLETTRALLLKISNACTRELKPLDSARVSSSENLMRALGITELQQASLLAAVNAQRAILDLRPLGKIEDSTSIRDGLETQDAVVSVKVPKAQAKKDIAAATDALSAIVSIDAMQARAAALVTLQNLKDNEARLTDVTRDAMLKAALEFFDEQQCPVCQTPWKPDEFRAVVTAQRKLLEEAAREREEAEKVLSPLIDNLETLPELLSPLASYARNLPSPIDPEALNAMSQEVSRRARIARTFLPLDDTINVLERDITETKAAENLLVQLAAAVEALPEASARDAARDYLTVGQERLEAWRQAVLKHAAAKRKAELAEQVYTVYGDTCDKALEDIYKDVEAEFRALYRTINKDDESTFEAQLTPSLGKLGFEVDFYGKGFFPPGAYHSEGHQDGMGLCLYLALMKHLLGGRFTFAVLDDVLMSVDAGHRREVCSLLKTAFPNTQFVLTTHDNVWLNHMRSSKLLESKSAITFRKWHVDHGPSEWKDIDVWEEIDNFIVLNEIRAAASQLRHYLEYVAAEWSDRLGGRVEYRGDGRYELGDLLPAAIGAMNDLYKKAKAAAQSWGDKARVDELGTLHDAFSGAVGATYIERWQINPAIHYNEWANLRREDFAPVVAAYKELEHLFGCPACGDPLYVVRTGMGKEAVRCACSKVNLNLKVRLKEATLGR